MRMVSMNVLPQRESNLKDSIPRLVDQCDIVKINLVNFKGEPKVLHEYNNIEIHHFENVGAEYKFVHYSDIEDDDYYITVDDDILYPENYIDKHINTLESYESAITCVHGSILNLKVNSRHNSRRRIFFLKDRLNKNTPVHVCGTGTTCMRGDSLNFSMDEFKIKNMDDYYISSFAKKQDVKIISIKREHMWLKPMNEGGVHIWGNNPKNHIDKLVNEVFK